RNWKPSFRDKLVLLGVTITMGSFLLFGAAVWWQNHELRLVAERESLKLAHSDLNHVADSVYALCESNRAALERGVRQNLNAVAVLLERAGNVHTEAGPVVG